MIENILYFKYDLLILILSTYFSYFSLKIAKKRYQYKFSFILFMIGSFLVNICFLIMGNSINLNYFILIIFIVIYNIFVPFLAVRKAYYAENKI
jgi:hypothetical protein